MATIKLYNSLKKEIQEFNPINPGVVLMYTCGPTIYNNPHIGNYRAYIFADILRRTLEANSLNVKQVVNLTDVDDKTIKRSIEVGLPLIDFTKKYEDEFYVGRSKLNLEEAFKYPRATSSISEMIKIIQELMDNGHAYKSDDGSIYFKISSDASYGKLVEINKENLLENASGRISADEYEKDAAEDFALWKAYDESDGDVFWNSPFGKGRPGWHIECSAMAREFLGETIDIHTGGVDNMFPHHENEIAQSECANGKVFSNFFLHCEHLLVDGRKMAKRDGNFLMLEDLEERSVSPMAYKYFLYGTHYRSPANMTWDALNASQTSLMRMYEKFIAIINQKSGTIDSNFVEKIIDSLNNDLNTAEALASFVSLFDANLDGSDKLATILKVDQILGLGFNEYYGSEPLNIPDDIRMLARERDNARAEKDYAKSDELRETLNQRGYIVIDTKDSSVIAKTPLS